MAIDLFGTDALRNLFSALGAWVNNGSRKDVDNGAKEVAKAAQKAIRAGSGADGTPLTPLRKSTLDGPIRRENDSRKRSDLGSTPLNATGKTADSITSKKVGFDTWEISSNSEHGNMVLASNAKRTHSGSPFTGDTPKVVRDPLQVSDKQIDILEKALLDGLEKVINGP